ncbi:glycoside hydrolase family 29 protein [Mycena olivaceomarginata]|nr:glycoside hydrolase family 29 protein [Mycena olivaceomarginata]
MATQAVLFLLSSLCAQFLTGYGATLPEYPSQPLPLSGLLNNKPLLQQTATAPPQTSTEPLHFLYAGDGTGGKCFSFLLSVYAKNWWVWANVNRAAIALPLHEKTGKNLNATNIFQWSTSVPSESPVESITFPPKATSNRMHVFGLSITPSTTNTSGGPALAIRRARFTTRWEDIEGVRAQAVEVTLANLLPAFAISRNTSITTRHTVELVGSGIQTVTPGVINRLVPADQVRVDVFVTGSTANGNATIQIRDSSGNVVATSGEFPTSPLVENYTPDADSLSMHETPSWWNAAKYGIFIHWGVYSTPAWAPPTSYAEWYDWDIRQPPNSSNPTWEHHLETYGKPQNSMRVRVDLFDRAGAKYFVLVSKHHDGFALFDTGNTTNRNSVQFGPKRDLVAELFQTAKAEKPEMHRGTYYSMPEWFNPDFAKYGFGQWPGGLAHNAFNVSPALEPYTGRIDIDDYIDDLQLPQMIDLAVKYDTEIMWCDIGGPNKTLDFAATFYNHAMAQGRQVTMNDRCGFLPDFDTPEYATFGSIQTAKWESSEGMDPFSYGLNTATNADQYKNGTTIVQTLVDIVSRTGICDLLDIGPTAEGEIIAPMMNNLLDAGTWLDFAGDCVYDTEYWFPSSQDFNPPAGTEPPRFTTTPSTFCLTINKRLPVLAEDEIVFLRPQGPTAPLLGILIDVPESDVTAG